MKVALTLVVLLGSSACVRTIEQSPLAATDDERACAEDEDCAVVDDWSCGCDVAANVDSVTVVEERRPNIGLCDGADRPACIASDALCLSGRCTLIE